MGCLILKSKIYQNYDDTLLTFVIDNSNYLALFMLICEYLIFAC